MSEELEYTLFVSYDCGSSYCPEITSSDLDELQEQAKTYDEQGLRWTIEDDNGDYHGICNIHAGIFAMMAVINKQ